MILAAAACAAAGISYIFNDDEQSINTKYETVTASSTIIDKQGIIKYVIHPRVRNPYSFMFCPEQKCVISFIKKFKSNQLKVPREKNYLIVKREFSLLFFWSMPLKAQLLQISTKTCLVIENLNRFQRNLMKISIGTQNGTPEYPDISYIPSEIALSNYDQHSYENIIPIGILKKKKLDFDENEKNQKKFCFNELLDPTKEKIMRNMIFKNVNLCVENLSKLLSESCSDTDEQLTTLQKSSSLVSAMNNNNSTKQKSSDRNSKFFQHDESINSDPPFYLHNDNSNTNLNERFSDGIILYRGKQFGLALGEPMIRKTHENENLSINSSHSINELNRLLSKSNCLLMQQYQIESIEDLIRLYLQQGQQQFTQLMIHLFQVNPSIVEQFNHILTNWSKTLT